MEKEFVTYEQALSLKELDYDEPCFGVFINGNFNLIFSQHQLDSISLAPLKSQIFRWFRDKYNLWSYVYPYIHDKDWHFHIQYYDSDMWGEVHLGNKFKTYEDAEDACIDKLIEIAKKQKDGI
jgi:hypothetical protein